YGDKAYTLVLQQANFDEAEAYCRSLSGGHLASVHSADEWSFINRFLTENGNLGWVWFGLTDRVSEGSFQWTDGSPVGFTAWDAGEPNNQPGDGDSVFIKLQNGARVWKDGDQMGRYKLLCKSSA
ncbi:hypothetical protein CAPTEDRAFT_86677, partial [Capitella teleta]